MVEYRRNTAALRKALEERAVFGYPLKVPVFGDAEAVSMSIFRNIISVLASPLVPMEFEDYVAKRQLSTEKHDRDYWVKWAQSRNIPRGEFLAWMPSSIQTQLQEGYKVSQADIEREHLRSRECLDRHGRVTCDVFDISKVQVPVEKIKPGMMLQFEDKLSKAQAWPGRVVAVEPDPEDGSKVVFIETIDPTPFLSMPEASAPWMIDPSFIPDETWVIGYGTYEAMQRKNAKIPKGKFAEDAPAAEFNANDDRYRLYYLDEPMPLSKIEKFCAKYYPKARACVWQSTALYVVPIHPAADKAGRHEGGIFRPVADTVWTGEIKLPEYGPYGTGEMEVGPEEDIEENR